MSPRSLKPDASLAALGDVVKALRREKGLTQERLARQADIPVTYLSKIENGQCNLTWATLIRLCSGLGMQRSALLARVEEAESTERGTGVVSQASANSDPAAAGTMGMSVRLPEELAVEIDGIARVEGVSISEAIRASVYRFIARRRADKDFQQRLRKRMEEDLAVIERLAE
jgi:transcriptional regulator with XRE-family HTH domain